MAYPYGALATGKTDGTNLQTDHPAHHNAMAAALNDLLTELGSDPGGGSDVTARLTALEAGAPGGVELLANKDIVGGYLGIDATTGTSEPNRAPPDRRFSYSQRALSMFLGNVSAQVVKELWITDSFGHAGSSNAEQTSSPARYEAEMARAFNSAPRGDGHQPVELWNGVTVTTDGAMAWDDIPAGQRNARGSCLADKNVNAGQHATTTRNGSAVTVYYTAWQTLGAVVSVTINGFTGTTIAAGSNGVNTATFAGAGVLNVADASSVAWPSAGFLLVATGGTTAVVSYTAHAGTTFTGCTTISGGGVMATGGAVTPAIDNREPTLPAATFMSGRSLTFGHPTSIGPITITLTHAAIGTSFELDSGYFHESNSTSGHMLLRACRSGIQIAAWADATTGLPLHQFIANQLPHIVTIMCGVNDAAPTGGNASASTVATSLTTLLTAIRAQYGTWTPAIRYVFQYDATYVPASWTTTYRDALREVCIANDVIFIDANEALGPIRASDFLDVSDDGLHPNDKAHRAIGLMMGHYSTNASSIRNTNLSLGAIYAQEITAFADRLTLYADANPSLSLLRDAEAAVTNGQQLGYFGFKGAVDAYGTPSDVASAVAAVAEQTFTSAGFKTGLRFYTTAVATTAIVGGISGDGDLWNGATTLANAPWQVASNGNVQSTGNIKHNGSLQIGQNSTATYQGEFYNFGSQPILALRHAGGTRTAPTGTTSLNNVASIYFQGYEVVTPGYGVNGGARITANAAQTYTDVVQGTTLRFYCTPNGTAAVVEGFRIDSTGALPTLRTNGALTVGGLTAVATGAAFEVVSGGWWTTRQQALAVVNGANSNLAVTSSLVILSGPTGAFNITGVAGGTDGARIRFVYLGAQALTITHQATSTAANQITCLTGADVVIGSAACSFELVYDSGTTKWILIDSQT